MKRIKRVEVFVYGPEQKLLKRLRIVPPRGHVKGTVTDDATYEPMRTDCRNYFTAEGAEDALCKAVGALDAGNPGNRWRLVPIGGWQFKLVWEDDINQAKADELGRTNDQG